MDFDIFGSSADARLEERIAALEAETAALKAYVWAMFGGERPHLGSQYVFRRGEMETAQRVWDGLFGGDARGEK